MDMRQGGAVGELAAFNALLALNSLYIMPAYLTAVRIHEALVATQEEAEEEHL